MPDGVDWEQVFTTAQAEALLLRDDVPSRGSEEDLFEHCLSVEAHLPAGWVEQPTLRQAVSSEEAEEWKEAARCWESKCGKCGEVLYSKGATIAKMKDGLRALPETI